MLLLRTLSVTFLFLLTAVAQDPERPPPPPPVWPESLERSPARLSDDPIPLREGAVPARPEPILELGDPFLGTGPIGDGFTLPTGAVWQPRLTVFGTLRSAVQTQRRDGRTISEWANRLDLFTNLQLSGTERILFGIRPLDREANPFSGYVFAPDEQEGWRNGFDAHVESLFFEGDFGELFPGSGRGRGDIGFSVGRQPIRRQDGLLIDDALDAVGITRNTLRGEGISNLQITALWAWNEVHRGDNVRDEEAQLFSLFALADFRRWSIEADLVWVDSDARGGDSLHLGLAGIRRLGEWSTTVRVLGSMALGAPTSRADDGLLLWNEWSRTPHGGEDLFYVNGYLAVADFRSASRAPAAGGPLGRVGILFAAVGLGQQTAPLPDDARRSAGAAVGYQWQFEDHSQLVLEAGGRVDFGDVGSHAIAVGGRFQVPLSRRTLVQIDAHLSQVEREGIGFGARLEFVVKF